MKCTAPITGVHRTESGRERCPIHGRGRGGTGSGHRGPASGSAPSVALAAPGPLVVALAGAPLSGPRQSSTCAVLVEAGFEAALSRDLVAALLNLAGDLEGSAARDARTGHELCELLADAADALDPDLIIGSLGDSFVDILTKQGTPIWFAVVVGKGVEKVAQTLLGHLLPAAQLSLGLRVLAMLVCSNPETCPAADQWGMPVLESVLEETRS